MSEDLDIITINAHSITDRNKFVKIINYSGHTTNGEQRAGSAILVKRKIPHTFHISTVDKNMMAVTMHTNQTKLTMSPSIAHLDRTHYH